VLSVTLGGGLLDFGGDSDRMEVTKIGTAGSSVAGGNFLVDTVAGVISASDAGSGGGEGLFGAIVDI
jgi:hypothetical protein